MRRKEKAEKTMPRAYAMELRIRVIKALEEGMRIINISKLFNVSRDTIYKWKGLKDKQGNLKAAKGYQKGHSHKIRDPKAFKEFFETNKNKTSKELAIQWGNISPMTILREIRKLGYSYKKNFSSSKKEYWVKE